MKIRLYRNNVKGAPRLWKRKLPIRQTLLWLGALFILIQRGPRDTAR